MGKEEKGKWGMQKLRVKTSKKLNGKRSGDEKREERGKER
jgi:hypothetical protein